jgi:hypothetical protein
MHPWEKKVRAFTDSLAVPFRGHQSTLEVHNGLVEEKILPGLMGQKRSFSMRACHTSEEEALEDGRMRQGVPGIEGGPGASLEKTFTNLYVFFSCVSKSAPICPDLYHHPYDFVFHLRPFGPRTYYDI